MPHVKFQSFSIRIDRDFQLSFGERKEGRKKERKEESSAFAQRAKTELKTKREKNELPDNSTAKGFHRKEGEKHNLSKDPLHVS